MVPNHTNQSVNAINQYKDLNTYKRKIKAEKTALDFRKQNTIPETKTQFQEKTENNFFFPERSVMAHGTHLFQFLTLFHFVNI